MNDDSDLMRDLRRGRKRALATLFERHHARLYRYCFRMSGDRQASEDLVQDVFMRMLKYRESFREGMAFEPWMFGIARNACVSHLRRSRLGRLAEQDLDELASEAAPEDERAELVRRALLALPVERREVLVLSRYELKSYEEIAAVLGCSVGAVKVRAHRALKELRERYLALVEETSV